MIFAPRSWPSTPGVATTTRILRSSDLSPGSVDELRTGQRVRDAVEQLGGREGLLDVVVRARGEAALDGGVVDAGREQDDRRAGELVDGAQPLGDLVAVELGHHHVDQAELGP